MKIVCDADGLIKINKAGLLESLAQYADLIVGSEVLRETVEEGKNRGYPDAYEIESALQQNLLQEREPSKAHANLSLPSAGLGSGEQEAYRLSLSVSADAILSDDRAFLNFLGTQQCDYLTPGAAIILLVDEEVISQADGLQALQKLQPMIQDAQYQATLHTLQLKQPSQEEDSEEEDSQEGGAS